MQRAEWRGWNLNRITSRVLLRRFLFHSTSANSSHHVRLPGALPIQLGELTELRRIGLCHNRISGRIPDEIGLLEVLQRLHCSNNELEGLRLCRC
jgi:hypothetical protein